MNFRRESRKKAEDMIFDTHVHYDDRRFDDDRGAVLSGLPGAGIGGAVNIGCDLGTSEAGRRLAGQYPFLYFSAGIYPDNVGEAEAQGEEKTLDALRGLLADPKAVAVGEIGLDYNGYDRWPDKPLPELQRKWLSLQLELAREMNKPVVIHSRDAAAETVEFVRHEMRGLDKVLHCLSYSREIAAQCLDEGCYLGIGGVVTFRNGRKMKDVVDYMPTDRILLETDCPYLAPEPFRGRRNASTLLPYVVRTIAEIKGISPEEVERISWENAMRFYRLDPANFSEVWEDRA